jgi:hypothetical protein
MAERLGTQLQSGGLEQSIHTGLLSTGLFGGASLDLNFAVTKNVGPLVSFTRASGSATYIDSAGTLRTAVTNLLLRSEEFDNASWSKVLASVTANQTTAPDGTSNADKLIGNATLDAHYTQQNFSGATSGISYTSTVFAKASELTRFELLHVVGSTLYAQGYDLSNGTLLTRVTGGTTAATGGFIQAVGNDWYRCGITQISDGTTGAVRCTLRSANTVNFDATSQGVFLWGAQLEQASTVGEYIPTTGTINSAPRFDHNPTTGESLGLLVEEQRTNLLLRSEEFDNASWTKTRSSITADSEIAPNGTLTADKVVEDTTASATHLVSLGSGIIAGNTYTYSVYAKSAGRNWIVLSPGGTWGFAWFNISSGTIGTVTSGGSSATAAIQSVGNGWYRCSVTSTAVDNRGFQILMATGNDVVTYTGNGTSGVFIWGAQLEAGAFPTSYIPTTTAAATRNADVANITGANFSSWYRQGTGSIFMKYILQNTTAAYSARFDNGSISDSVQFIANANNANINISSVAQYSRTSIPFVVNQIRVQCLAYELDNVNSVFDGILGVNDSLATIPTVNQLVFVGHVGPIARLTYWPQRLPNSTLQAITQ